MPKFYRIAAVCLLALCGAAPAWARLGVGPSLPIDPVKFPAVRNQDQVAAADNGSVVLLVWRDTRRGDGDIYAVRMEHDCRVLDPNGIEIAAGTGEQSEPAVAWDGSNWLVAWSDNGTVQVARVSPAGAVLDAPTIVSGAGHAAYPGVAWNGALHVVVWSEEVAGVSKIHGATVDDGGLVVAAGGPLSLGGSDVRPVIAAAGANALVAFRTSAAGNEDIHAFRVTAALPSGAITRLDAQDVSLVAQAETQDAPAVASDGSSWLVAWEDFRNRATNGSDIRGTRVSDAGAVLDAGTIAIAVGAGNDTKVALTHDGGDWLATWTASGGFQLLRSIANNGNPAGSTQIASDTVVGDGTFGGPVIVWSSDAETESDLLGRTLGSPLGSPTVLAFQTPNQTEPAQAFGSNRWMVAWVDDRFGPTERQIRFGLTDSARFEPPSHFTVKFAVPRPGIDQGHPSLVFDGTNYNLFWDEERGGRRIVVGARFTAGGAPLDTFTVAGEPYNQYEPTAEAVGNGDVVVAWTDARGGATERDIWMAQYRDGAQSGGRKAMAEVVGTREEHPSVTVVQGNHAVVAYETVAPGVDRGVEVAYIGLPISANGVGHDIVAKEPGRTFDRPATASNFEDGLIAFQEVVFSDGPALHTPKAAKWNGDNRFVSFVYTVAPGSYTPANPVVGSAGYDYVALWSSRLTGTIDVNATALAPGGDAGHDSVFALTSDPPVDTPGSSEHGQADRVGFTYLRSRTDSLWTGLQLYGGDARDTLRGEVLINEFLAHPSSGVKEFIELFNKSGRDFLLNGWKVVVDGIPNTVDDCGDIFLAPGGLDGGPDRTLGTPCSFLGNQEFFTDSTFFDWGTPDPVEGHLPDRGAVLELFTPGGILVDRVGYGSGKGAAPVSGAIPNAIAPAALSTPDAARIGDTIAALGDSTQISTSRIPNGVDTGNNATDFNLTPATTANSTNTGTAAQLGTTLFVSRVYWNPSSGEPTIELINPSTSDTYDFAGWYISNNVSTERIGVNTNAFSQMKPLTTRLLRRGEPGSFTFLMDQLSVVYLFGPDFTRYEQIGWSRPDNLAPDMCVTRLGGTGGTHDGFDWFTCGGQDNISSGELRYTTCTINSPTTDVPAPFSHLSFAGAMPNPSRASQAPVLVFTVPGAPGGAPVRARLALYDVAGRRVGMVVDQDFAPGVQRVPLQRPGRVLRAGTYYADLEVGGKRVRRTLVFLD